MQPAERQRRTDAEAAARRLVFARSQPFGFAEFVEQPTAALENIWPVSVNVTFRVVLVSKRTRR
jgi:hypothetical protein